ncbi:MAG: hypothetical protein M1833_006668 [Piccolia ochrophora]|nr:MAG: hypothetical protein M1833_006668 [Piccolia ochrophora]
MFSKASIATTNLDPATAEKLADLLYEMAVSLLQGKFYELATKWLERSNDVLVGQAQEKLSLEAGELRLSVMHALGKRSDMHQSILTLTNLLVKSLLGVGSDEAVNKAWNMDFGDKLVVLLLKLELIATKSADTALEYRDVLKQIMRTVVLTEWNFKLITTHIRRLEEKSTELACGMLDEFLRTRLSDYTDRMDWLEKFLITRIWMATKQTDTSEVRAGVVKTFDWFSDNISKTLSCGMLWKRIESHYNGGQFEAAASWCQVALHRVFQDTGSLNTAKIQRKAILCALSRQDFNSADEIFKSMSQLSQDMSSTRYLMFKVYIRSEILDRAAECLEKVREDNSNDATLPYACVLEAQEKGHRGLAIRALEIILNKVSCNAPKELHIPALLRCSARLLMAECGDDTVNKPEVVISLCKLFKGAASQAQHSQRDKNTQTEQQFSIDELNWFSRNSYNVALKSCTLWRPQDTLEILQACIRFIDLYPTDVDAQTLADLSLQKLFCNFLRASLTIVLARSEDNIHDQLQYYLELRSYVEDARKPLKDHLELLEGGAKEDLLKKFGTLLVFDFEAAARLKAWDDLTQLIDECSTCANNTLYETMADIILCVDAPNSTTISILRTLINKSVSPTSTSTTNPASAPTSLPTPHLARWLRILLQLSLTTSSTGPTTTTTTTTAESLLDTAISLARNQTPQNPYPPTELEHLTTTTFNRAIDFYCADDDVKCRAWAERAMALAACVVGDGGALRKELEERYLGLRWGGES